MQFGVEGFHKVFCSFKLHKSIWRVRVVTFCTKKFISLILRDLYHLLHVFFLILGYIFLSMEIIF